MEYLEPAVQITIIVSFVAAAFSFAVLQPRNEINRQLKESIDRLTRQIDKFEERQREMEIRIAERITEVDQRSKSAHHRLDIIDERLNIQRGDDH